MIQHATFSYRIEANKHEYLSKVSWGSLGNIGTFKPSFYNTKHIRNTYKCIILIYFETQIKPVEDLDLW